MLTDGDGGSSAPRTMQINVTAQPDGAMPLFNAEQVNTYTTSYQTTPAMARLADGGYVTIWQSDGQDGWGYGMFGQRFAADGTRVEMCIRDKEFRLNTYTSSSQYVPVLAALKDDAATSGTNETGFVAVWESYWQDGDYMGVYGQRFASDGSKVGDEFRVHTTGAGSQGRPDVAVLDNSHFVVVWHDSNTASVRGQLFTAGGVTIGGEFIVSTPDYNSDYGAWPHVTALANGGFVVSWDGYSSPSDGDYGVYAQQFNALGEKVDGPIELNASTPNNQHYPCLLYTSRCV